MQLPFGGSRSFLLPLPYLSHPHGANILTSFRDELYAFCRKGNTSSARDDQEYSSCFSCCYNCGACTQCMQDRPYCVQHLPCSTPPAIRVIACPETGQAIFHYSMTLATTPEPTVRPPSRIAKRRPCSIAIGVIRVISISMLSPGITISTPSGSLMVPVTSVVRK